MSGKDISSPTRFLNYPICKTCETVNWSELARNITLPLALV